MKLARLSDFTIAPEWCVASPQMGECGSESVSIKNLGDACLGRHALLLVPPIASRKRVFEAVCDGVGLYSDTDIEVLMSLNTLKCKLSDIIHA